MKKNIRQIVRSLGALSAQWMGQKNRYRHEAILSLQKKCGYAPAMANEILDDLFSELTTPKLWALLENELGDPKVLDGFQKDRKNSRRVRAFGPESILHVFAGNVPQPSVISVVIGLLVKSRNTAKISSEDSGLLGIYLESLKHHDPDLAESVSVLSGKGEPLEKALRRSGAVIVYGTDRTIRTFSKKISPKQIFIPYGHRMSFALFLKSALSEVLAKKTAKDLRSMDQKGCLSPLAIFIQAKGRVARDFCTALSLELLRPYGAWRVIYEENSDSMLSSWGNRTVIVRSFDSTRQVFAVLKKFSRYLQAATLEGAAAERKKAAELLSELGFNRICRAGRIQKPPLSWHHDGRMNLAPLLRWTDLE